MATKTTEEYLQELDAIIERLIKLRGWDAPEIRRLKKDVKDCLKAYREEKAK